ncbi:MAG: hypothetical protein ACR2H5_03310 [Ktedonobacteraceae bacterium]
MKRILVIENHMPFAHFRSQGASEGKTMKKYSMLGLLMIAAMLLLAACGGNTASTNPTSPTATVAGDRVVHVTITDNSIHASRTTFSVGVPYTFIVTNNGQVKHNFIIRTRVAGPSVSPPTKQGILYLLSAEKLPQGATQTVSYEFPLSTLQGHVEFATDINGQNGSKPSVSIPIDVKQGAVQ